ncbi:hypothetical protein [Candidatus Aquicultor secundus]|nr:hypothetical protein [Candidatus Aquicultor secundus]
MENSMKYSYLLIIIIALVLIPGCGYTSAPLSTGQRQSDHKKIRNDRSEIKTAWVEDSRYNPRTVMPFMAYKGYVYRPGNSVGKFSSNFKYVGTYDNREVFTNPDNTGTPPFYLWAKGRYFNVGKNLELFIRAENTKSSSIESIKAIGSCNDLELAIELPKHPYSVGVQYWAKVLLKNLTSNDIELIADKLFELQVMDSAGYRIWPEHNGWGKPVPNIIESRGTYSAQRPFTIGLPGKYTILCQLKYNSGKIGKLNKYGLVDGVSFNPPTIKTSPREIMVK